MGFHDVVSLASEAAVEAMQVESGHPQLAVRVVLAAGVRRREYFEVLEFDSL